MDGPLHGWHSQTPSPEMKAHQACVDDPMLPQCQRGIYSYILNNHANTAFLVCFIIVIITLVCIGSYKRRAYFYSIALWAGLMAEALGYAARNWSADNQLQTEPFYMQIVCLTVGPAFMAAAIYYCMRHMVVGFGSPQQSPIPPESYTRIFIPCDLVSLILQATGGALAAKAHKAHDQSTMDKGTNIMIAGLAFQVFTMCVFGILGLVFLWRAAAAHQLRVRNCRPLNHLIVATRSSTRLKAFIWSIVGSTLLIFARCCYRVAELSGGWSGNLMQNQSLFIVCEGIFILFASMLLTAAHPALTAPEVLEAGGRFTYTHEPLSTLVPGWTPHGPDEEAGQRPVPTANRSKDEPIPVVVTTLLPAQSTTVNPIPNQPAQGIPSSRAAVDRLSSQRP